MAGRRVLHFYTLNLERSVQVILDRLGIVPERAERVLPWRSAAAVRRPKEDVRPIFWANRPKSYLARTQGWDEFPNGRWGDSGSPAFGDLADHHLAFRPVKPDVAKDRWGRELGSIGQVRDVFRRLLPRATSTAFPGTTGRSTWRANRCGTLWSA